MKNLLGRGWQSWQARSDPGSQMPGVWEEIHGGWNTVLHRLKTHSGMAERILWLKTAELMAHLEWWGSYYHFVRFHESLDVKLATLIAVSYTHLTLPTNR